LDGTQALFLFSGENIHYFSAPSLENEWTVLVLGQVKKDVGRNWKIGLTGQYFFQDQVLDVSMFATEQAVLPVKGHRLTGRPMVRWDFRRPFWLEIEGAIHQQYLLRPLDDFREAGPRLTLGVDISRSSDLTISHEYLRRWHETRTQVDREGFSLPGTELEFDLHRLELAWRQDWDTKRRWRSTTKLTLDINTDNGSGFYDYQRYQFSQILRHKAPTWEIRGQARIAYYDYPVQTVSFDDDSKRRRTALRFNLRGEKNLGKAVKIFAEYEHERSLSDFFLDDYEVNTIMTGIDWEF